MCSVQFKFVINKFEFSQTLLGSFQIWSKFEIKSTHIIMNKDIEDLEDIIRILIDMLIINNVPKDTIILELRKYHYCFDCRNHFRGCKCGETSESESINDDYTSSIYSEEEQSE